ncbi:golgin subfamily B member 1 [Latimeria chalumnae]|uniref:golgin subfamily B member 1 n=1 Tax=Latimeria chalumnae TaxID=7897 RepID=UPI00313C173E
MWKWYSEEEASTARGASGPQEGISKQSVTDITEQLMHTQQLVVQLKELIREKDNELQSKDQQLKEEKEAWEARVSKVKLQSKAKATSLNAQLEELKKQLSASGLQGKTEQKKASSEGDQEHSAANRGKILVLRKKNEELELQLSQKNAELQSKITELEAQRQRGSEMDAMLAEKDKKLAEKEAYIIDLQLAAADSTAQHPSAQVTEVKNQLPGKNASLQDMETLVQNLTRKVGESDEKYSLLQQQTESLKDLFSKEQNRFQEREAMYMENIRVFQGIIQEKEKEIVELGKKHEQELFRLVAKSDASADLEQLLKALKQKLHEKEEVLLGRTQVVDMLQKELDSRDQEIKEVNEKLKRLHLEKDNLQSKLEAEKHVMRAQLRDLMEKHELERKHITEKHNAELRDIQEKHETELSEKEQRLLQFQKEVEVMRSNGQITVEKGEKAMDAVTKQRLDELEAQVKLKTEEASKSEAKFLKMKAWSKARIRQVEDELKNAQLGSNSNDLTALRNRISELEEEKEHMQEKLDEYSGLKTQNEELLVKLESYEEQQRKMQADLEQFTKRAASQASESGSTDEIQGQLLEWQEMMPETEIGRDQAREEKSSIGLQMTQIEEEREAIVSGQQDLEEELAQVRGLRRQQIGRKQTLNADKLQGDYEFDGRQHYEDPGTSLESGDGENMGGWWPVYTSPHTGVIPTRQLIKACTV